MSLIYKLLQCKKIDIIYQFHNITFRYSVSNIFLLFIINIQRIVYLKKCNIEGSKTIDINHQLRSRFTYLYHYLLFNFFKIDDIIDSELTIKVEYVF